jgi:hypothetical protein
LCSGVKPFFFGLRISETEDNHGTLSSRAPPITKQEHQHTDRQIRLLVTYLFTPWSRVLLEKLTGSQLVKIFPAFYGIPMFITAFTRARHLSLS